MLSFSVTWVCDKCNCSIDCVQLLISFEFCEIIPYVFITCVRLLQHVFVELIEQTVCFTMETARLLDSFVTSLDRSNVIPREIRFDDV